ncbi:hypothetical protein FQZ97_1066030 [compost metagenome]
MHCSDLPSMAGIASIVREKMGGVEVCMGWNFTAEPLWESRRLFGMGSVLKARVSENANIEYFEDQLQCLSHPGLPGVRNA